MFKLIKQAGRARRGEYITPHGVVQTPVFMNVGTQAAIKGGLSGLDLANIGCQVELSNTYHLHVRPGDELIRDMGGLHAFMRWDGPILTDSGGFQIFSLGSDIAMAFDECVGIPAERSYVEASCDRTVRWLKRCKDALYEYNARDGAVNPGQALWGINQGAVFHYLRIEHMKKISDLDLPGYAIGGLAVGESTQEMYDTIQALEPYMPKDKPRYLMGVGTPCNILESVYRGVDFFDCVMPARNGRHGHLYTWEGVINIKNEKYARDESPIDPACKCPVCRRYSRAYLRHLFKSEEILALRLSVMHNLYFYNSLTAEIRRALDEDRFESFYRANAEKLDKRI